MGIGLPIHRLETRIQFDQNGVSPDGRSSSHNDGGIGDTAVTVSKVDAGLVCGMTYKGINACKPSISGSNPKPPTKQCCSDLATTDLPCLCTHKNSFLFRVLGIDSKLAMQLPPKCNLKLPAHC